MSCEFWVECFVQFNSIQLLDLFKEQFKTHDLKLKFSCVQMVFSARGASVKLKLFPAVCLNDGMCIDCIKAMKIGLTVANADS